MAAVLAAAVFMWPGGDGMSPQAWAEPVVVQDVATPDPERSVMVYSTPDSTADRVTVIWLFSDDSPSDES